MPSKKAQSRRAGDDATPAHVAEVPLQVSFRHLPVSAAVVQRLTAEAQKLGRYADGITHCHVVVEAPHRHHRLGKRYALHLEIGVPGEMIAIAHEPPSRKRLGGAEKVSKEAEVAAADKDLYVVIRKVFDLARRRLQDHVRRARGDVKRHATA